MTSEQALPFTRYKQEGLVPLGPLPKGVSSRHDYGPLVFEQCGTSCAYCDRELSESYESWLDITVDHVVPQSIGWKGEAAKWVEDIFNCVTCCRACNEFLQPRYQEQQPASIAEFVAIRNNIFLRKRTQAKARHLEEQKRYEAWRKKERPTVAPPTN